MALVQSGIELQHDEDRLINKKFMEVFLDLNFLRVTDEHLGRSKCCGNLRTGFVTLLDVFRVLLVESSISAAIPPVGGPVLPIVRFCRNFIFGQISLKLGGWMTFVQISIEHQYGDEIWKNKKVMEVFLDRNFLKVTDEHLGRSKCCGNLRTGFMTLLDVFRVLLVESAISAAIPPAGGPVLPK